jgi:hypothetical protein
MQIQLVGRHYVTNQLIPASEPARIAGNMMTPDPESNVVTLPPSRERLTDIVKAIAAESNRWSINAVLPTDQGGRSMVNRRQVELCLKEGYVCDERASIDRHGNWQFEMARVCAGLDVRIDVVVESAPSVPKLFVIAVRGDQI